MNEDLINLTKNTVEMLGFTPVEIKILKSKNNSILKIVIYNKNNDISIDDCANVSNVLLRRIELDYPNFSNYYSIIVESPGVDRKLKTIEEISIFVGKEIKFNISDIKKYNLKENVVVGLIEKVENNKILIKKNNEILIFDYDDIKNPCLYFDIKKYLK